MRKLKNLKISNAIVLLWCLSIVSTLIIGIIGFNNMKKLNDNIESMYKTNLVEMEYLSDISGNIGVLRNAFTKVIDREYNEVNIKIVEESDTAIREKLKQVKSLNEDTEEEKIIDSILENYNKYMENFTSVKESRKKGQAISKSILTDLGKDGDNISTDLESLIEIDKNNAKLIYNDSMSKYNHNKNAFLIIFIVVVAVMSVICLTIMNVIKTSIKQFSNILEIISCGDFTVKVEENEKNEFGKMKKDLSLTINSISSILKVIKQNMGTINEQAASLSSVSEEMASSSEEVTNAIQGVAEGSTSQAGELVEIANNMSSFGNAVDNIVSSVSEVDTSAKNVNNMANSSNEKLTMLVTSIKDISSSFKEVSTKIATLGTNIGKINEITVLINNIADQTNLLALNAAIEAARAGEAGMGFNVVAEEIRKLAEQSKASSTEIGELLKKISLETNGVIDTTGKVNIELKDQVSIVDDSILSFKEIINAIEHILPLIENTTHSINKINKEKDEILIKVEGASSVAEENSATSEEIAASAQEMNASSEEVSNSSEKLSDLVLNTQNEINKFKL